MDYHNPPPPPPQPQQQQAVTTAAADQVQQFDATALGLFQLQYPHVDVLAQLGYQQQPHPLADPYANYAAAYMPQQDVSLWNTFGWGAATTGASTAAASSSAMSQAQRLMGYQSVAG